MAWRGLHLTRPSHLSFAEGQVVVDQDDGEEVRLSLEDLAWIVLDAPHSTLSARLLSECMCSGIVLLVTDQKHAPAGLVLPFHRHHRQAEVARLQIEASAPLKKRIWQAVVRAKIVNQAAALEALGREGAKPLIEMSRLVASGDPDNVEARAARHYWSKLWPDFRREDDGDRRNKLLNYGYAVIRAGIARALVAAGLLPAFGLKHASVSNAFNLADDFVEPMRPFVDVLAWRNSDGGTPSRGDLSVEDRRMMASILLADARIGGDDLSLLTASERTADTFV